MNTDMSTELARKMLEQRFLNEQTYSISDLFKIRDHCLGLAFYGLEDKELLNEVNRYLIEMKGKQYA